MTWIRIRTPVLHWRWIFLVQLVRGLWLLLRWLAVHGTVTAGLLAATLLWWVIAAGGWPWLLVIAGLGLAGGVYGMESQAQWWRRLAAVWHSRRRLRWYHQHWELAMDGAGLSRPDDLPTLMVHRFGGQLGERDLDVLTVHMLPGQIVSDWRAQQVRLAAAWGLQRLRCHPVPGQPGDVLLMCRRYGLQPATVARWQERAQLHPTVQPTVQPQLQLVDPEGQAKDQLLEDLQLEVDAARSTPVEPAVDERPEPPRGAFPRQPRSGQ